MALKTRPFRLKLLSRAGSLYPGAVVKLQLTSYQVDGLDVVKLVWPLTEEPSNPGYYSSPVWPTGRGTGGVQYQITADAGDLRMAAALMSVPDGASDAQVSAELTVNATPWPPIYAAASEVAAARIFSEAAAAAASLAAWANAGAGTVLAGINARFYPGNRSSAPATRDDGTACQTGDRATINNVEFIFLGGVWTDYLQAARAAAADALAYKNTAGASATNAGTSETNARTSETNARTSETNAGVSAGTAVAAANRAEAARDSTLVGSNLAVDEPTGRLTVANGQTYAVQGSGDVSVLVYRRIDAATPGTLVTTYPASRIQFAAGLRNTLPNLFAEETVDISAMPDRYVDAGVAQATVAASSAGYLPCWRAQVGLNTTASVAWRFPISSLAGQPVFSCALRFLAIDAANGGSGNRSVRVIVSQIDGAGAGIAGTTQTVVIRDQTASTGESTFALETQAVNVAAASVQIRLEIQNANGTAVRNVYFRDPLMAAGPVATFRRPPDARATAAEAIAGVNTLKIITAAVLAAALGAATAPLSTQLTTLSASIDALVEYGTAQKIALPAWLQWPEKYPVALYRTPTGIYKLLANQAYIRSFVAAAIWTVTPYYVDASRADDSGDGLTWATAKKRINAAISAANADAQSAMRIIIKGGASNVYSQSLSINGNSGLTGVEPTKPCALISDGNRVRHIAGTAETFPAAKNGTFTNTFVGGPSSATWVIDLVNLTNGRPTPIPQLADAAAVDAAAGGGWVVSNATGTTLTHVRRSDGLQPTPQNTAVLRNIHVAAFDNCTTDVYLEGIDFLGGPGGACWFDAVASRNVVANNCTFRFGGTSLQYLDGWRVRRTAGLVLTYQCDAASNWKDGFNYHWDRQSVASIVSSGGVATVTITADHALQTGESVTIAGAAQAAYNGTFAITVTSPTTFTYPVAGAPVSPATGTLTMASPPKMFVLNILATGGDNGRVGSSSNNDFTTHDNVVAIDIGGKYEPCNDGAAFHCIEDSLTLAVGTSVTTGVTGDSTRTAFKVSNNGKMGLLGTTATCPAAGNWAVYAQGVAGRMYLFEHTTVVGSNVADTGGVIINSPSLAAFQAG